MCIITRPGERASQKRRSRHSGFTLPEVLVSLMICMLLMQAVGQWSVLTGNSNLRMQQNQQAVLLAQTVLAGSTPSVPDGWTIQVEKQLINEESNTEENTGSLWEWNITVNYEEQTWQFYYVGEAYAQTE